MLTFLMASSTSASTTTFTNTEFYGRIGFFYSSLAPYGEWIEIESGFYAWRPLHVHFGWRPYLYGRWVWTDFGWYWVSSEPFGWATFHYGRWYYDDFYGWIWIPDHTWGPAWVEWRYDDDFIGWAPLPPYATFSVTIGIRFTTRWVAPVHYWTFVRHPYFTTTSVYRYAAPTEYARRLIRTGRSVVSYEVDRDRIINRGVDRAFIERRGNTRIDRADVTTTSERGERVRREGGRERVEMYRPTPTDFQNQNENIQARRPERRLSLDLERIERSRPEMTGDFRNREAAPEARERRSEFERRIPERNVEQPEPRTSQERHFMERESRQREIERRIEERRNRWTPPSIDRQVQRPERIERRREMQREEVRPPTMRRESPQGSERGRGKERRRDRE